MNYLLVEDDCSDGTFGLVIEGNSMSPKFNPGDKIIVDPEVYPIPGDFVVARDEIKKMRLSLRNTALPERTAMAMTFTN
ncbi:S24 family peptidase [Pantoea stewartii]|uniref:S24 family peptidase n=1 Tax=Pantoea stewartii TaxID=66269 RepID=UPI0025A0DA51|nr:S24 family peptidase [Pantoea stewartii]